MGLLMLNLDQHPSEVSFDADQVQACAQEWFPEAMFFPGDQSLAEVQRAEANLREQLRQENLDGPAHQVLSSLKKKAAMYGPNYAFDIPISQSPSTRKSKPEMAPCSGVRYMNATNTTPNADQVHGLIRSVGIQFQFDQPLPPETRQRLMNFLKSLGIGYLIEIRPGSNQDDLIEDMNGPGKCLKGSTAPWLREPAAHPA